MSLSATRLSAALRSGLLSAGIGAVDGAQLTGMCDAIAAAVVTEVTAHASVSVTGTATGVTAGAAAVPVTGTGTVA